MGRDRPHTLTALCAFKLAPSEYDEHVKFADWLRLMNIPFNHCPNGEERPARIINGKRVSLIGNKLKRMGVKSGFPDFAIYVAKLQYHGLFIEMKATKKMKVTSSQKEWLELLGKAGYFALIANGADEAIEMTKSYLKAKE